MAFKIGTITAFVAVDSKDGDEGIIGIPDPSGSLCTIPAIAADEDRLKQLYPIIDLFCKNYNITYRVIRLSTRTDITQEFIDSI